MVNCKKFEIRYLAMLLNIPLTATFKKCKCIFLVYIQRFTFSPTLFLHVLKERESLFFSVYLSKMGYLPCMVFESILNIESLKFDA